MMGGKSWDAWIADYARSHENRVNRHTHLFGIPMIALFAAVGRVCRRHGTMAVGRRAVRWGLVIAQLSVTHDP